MNKAGLFIVKRILKLRKRPGFGDLVFDTLKHLFLLLTLAVTAYPFLNLIAYSLNEGLDAVRPGIHLLPRSFTWENYRYLLNDAVLIRAALNSVLRTLIAIFTQLFCNSMVAYALSKRNFVLRKFYNIMYIIPLYIGGGLIPTYFLLRALGLVGSFHVYWIPGLTAFYYIILMRTYFRNLPLSLSESAYVDGASDWTVFMRIILPLSLPLMAALALFIGVGAWNSWIDTLIYNQNRPELTTLQFELMRRLQSANQAMNANVNAFAVAAGKGAGMQVTPKVLRAAMTIIAVLPIVLLYPFLQKYFIHGLTIGGIKE